MKIGRNAPCPCGLGKKYKKCCLGEETMARMSSPDSFGESAATVSEFFTGQLGLPERHAMDVLDDWMQEGYGHSQNEAPTRACDLWWRVWQALLPRLEPSMRTMDCVDPVLDGMQLVSNWPQDFEMELHDAALEDSEYAERGRAYCEQWLAQFVDEDSDTQAIFRSALSDFLFRLGRAEEGEANLRAIIERWPTKVSSYVGLADAYAHTFRGASSLPMDLQRAEEILKQGLAAVDADDDERCLFYERLEGLREKREELDQAR